jgi:peptidoglycan/xylan/chitin deacetylase (PgdA/CDA1 family)
MNPGGPGKVLIFWDYDTQWGADRSRTPGGRKEWGELEFSHTERLLEIHAEFGVNACFAAVGAAALAGSRPYHDPCQIRRIHGLGHEVASHSFRHEWLPGLTPAELRETAGRSKDALEQCVGGPVTSFVPPFNQPFDCPRRMSFSLAERREARAGRSDLITVCKILAECGYRFCRVAYRPIYTRAAEWLTRKRLDSPARLERLGGVTCARLNTPGGFDDPSLAMIDRCAHEGGMAVVYGHPHSLLADNSQNLCYLRRFLKMVRDGVRAQQLEVVQPRQLVEAA